MAKKAIQSWIQDLSLKIYSRLSAPCLNKYVQVLGIWREGARENDSSLLFPGQNNFYDLRLVELVRLPWTERAFQNVGFYTGDVSRGGEGRTDPTKFMAWLWDQTGSHPSVAGNGE